MKIKIAFFFFFLVLLCNAQVVSIPDANFKAKLISASSTEQIAKNLSGVYFKIDSNNDGEIQESEALQVSYLYVTNSSISSLEGINYFTNLVSLYCELNQLVTLDINGLSQLQVFNCSFNQLTSLNLTGLTNIKNINCGQNQLTSLNVTGFSTLLQLICYNNQLSSLTVSSLTSLQRLECNNNQLTTLNTSGLTTLQYLVCNNNLLSTLNVNGLPNVTYFICGYNQLATLNVADMINLQRLDCNNNLLTTLGLNGLTKLINLNCSYNHLTSLFMKNGKNENPLNFYSNPSLQYICADESQITNVQSSINVFGYTNCFVNSYCSFTPGGTFYTIQGTNRYDEDANGCSPSDIIYPNFKLNFSDGTNSATLVSNTSGTYRYDVQSGTQTITPLLENPTYFVVSPTTASVIFPSTASPYAQNFCVAPNGNHNDLEVTLLPIGIARPGFDAYYKIVYKNKGTHSQSGTISLDFDDTIMDLLSAYPVTSNQVMNSLTWNFNNLLPFETRAIDLVLNLNSPLETPPLNSGSFLYYTVNINGFTDETPIDNVSALSQPVINSLDPNDKICIEGTTIEPSVVGNYVHYIINFENTGTAEAQNIVVKDIIDTTKYDITSLIPLAGSASFITRITTTNQVEFVFQNINLPFTPGSNDGYVAFKIKTKPTLVLGDAFSNTANIYFDYNAPIVTNTATTTIAALANPTFAFSDYFTLSPVPTKGTLSISSKQDSTIKSVSIYNTLGQLMLVTSNPSKTIDVSDLTSGSYFIKVITDKGSSSETFIKE